MYLLKELKNKLNHTKKINRAKEWFAALGVAKQLSVVLIFGFVVVMLSGIILGSFKSSYLIFVDPPELSLMENESVKLFFSFILMLFGLIISGFIISVLSASLENTFRDIRKGRLKYYGDNHTLIINYNRKVMNILKEIELHHKNTNDYHEVVIMINNDRDIEKLQTQIEKNHFKHLKIFVRFGDTFLWDRYEELSIHSVYAIIVLSDEDIKDTFVRDNNNLRIVNLLFSNEIFKNYLRRKREKKDEKPVKAVVEFSDVDHFDSILKRSTESLFLALSPTNVLSSILNLSMINIDFYTTWSHLLSFDGYELYFINPKEVEIPDCSYKDLLLRQQEGILIGISRFEDGGGKLFLNAQNEIRQEGDWLIFIAKDIYSIHFLDKAPDYKATLTIKHPQEIFKKHIAMVGKERVLGTNKLLDTNFKVESVEYDNSELYDKLYYDRLLLNYDSVIINLDDERIYRIAYNLMVLYDADAIKKFVFIVDDALIYEQIKSAGFKNTILSHLLISNYMAQVANQIALHEVFNILFVKEGPQINFINAHDVPNNIEELRYELINNDMVYLGIVKDNGSVEFEADNLEDVSKIIVLSDGEY